MGEKTLLRQAVKIVILCVCWYSISAANNHEQCPYQADIPSVSPPNDSHHGPPAGRVRLPRTHAHRLERRTDPIRLSTLLPSYHGPSGYREAFCLALRTRQYSKSATVLCPHSTGMKMHGL